MKTPSWFNLNSYSTYKYMKVSRFARTGLLSYLRTATAVTLIAAAMVSAIFGVSGSMAATRVGSTSKAHKIGQGKITSRPEASTETSFEVRQAPSVDSSFQKFISGTKNPARVPSSHVPTPQPNAVSSVTPFGFNALRHRDSRFANGGNQFSIEPPDQGLAVGTTARGGHICVVEAVNSVIAVFDGVTQSRLAFSDLNSFYGLPPQIIRTPVLAFGPDLTDPRVYFDNATSRWFVTVVEIDVDVSTGALLNKSSLLIAVSQTSDPTGVYNIYSVPVQDDGTDGTPSHPGCPCFGDQPLIGADANAFFLSTNEFSIHPFGAVFNGAQIYALSKNALASGAASVNIQSFSPGALAEGISYSVQPAIVPPGGSFESANSGTEYFLSALDFFGTLDNRIAVWAATNTSSISSSPDISLQNIIIESEVYGQPPDNEQPRGPLPLADLLKTEGFTVHEELVASNDDRMQQTSFAAGRLWSSVNTVVKTTNGPTRTGAAFFIVTPGFNGSNLTASVANQGYVSVNNQGVDFPSIGVNSSGNGVICFSLIGRGVYPSQAFAKINAVSGAGTVMIPTLSSGGTPIVPAVLPDDGFTGYPPESGLATNVGRWGDYTAAVSDANGNIWFGAEYIPNTALFSRSTFANWGTFISAVTP